MAGLLILSHGPSLASYTLSFDPWLVILLLVWGPTTNKRVSSDTTPLLKRLPWLPLPLN